MIKTLVIFIIASNSNFAVDSKIDYLYFDVGEHNKDCVELISEFRDANTTYTNTKDERNNHTLKDGSIFVGGSCF